MIDMTADTVERLEHEARALELLAQADGSLQGAYGEAAAADFKLNRTAHFVQSVGNLLALTSDRIKERAREHANMIGWQVATYEIAELARDPANEGPITWLTGNAMLPALRNLDALERIWQADHEGELWEIAVDALERKLDELNVYMGAPDYDNALYVVDLERWEHIDEEDMPEGADDLADEWKKRS